MLNLLFFAVLLTAGVLLGYLLRGHLQVDLSKMTIVLILVLIFSLGFNIGSSNNVLNSLLTVGVHGLVFALLTVLFSVGLVILVRRKVKLE